MTGSSTRHVLNTAAQSDPGAAPNSEGSFLQPISTAILLGTTGSALFGAIYMVCFPGRGYDWLTWAIVGAGGFGVLGAIFGTAFGLFYVIISLAIRKWKKE